MRAATHRAGGQAVRILVVDDHADVRVILRHLLGQQGHEVDLASDLQGATVLASVNAYDRAVVDLLLPDEADGLAAIEALRLAGIPRIVLMTGALPEVLARLAPRLRELGVSVLLKPFPTVPEVMRALGIEQSEKTETPPVREG